ncbi:MAG: MFS transporter [Asgard group archaeon]|nr:MFS transporter [Asgard group archaeon]
MQLSKLKNAFKVFYSLNFNVKLVFGYSFFQSLGRGIWMGNVLSSWIYLIANESNVLLGLTSAITGLAMTITVLPAGFLTDKVKRQTVLRFATIFGFMGLLLAVLAQNIEVIFLALIFWGLFQGINRPSVESLFADSVESGNRSQIYAWAHLTRQFGESTGPFLNVFLFIILGDIWEVEILKLVMIFGILLSMISIILLLFFNDNKSLGIASEHLRIETNNNLDNSEISILISSQKTRIQPHQLIIGILLLSNLIIGFGAGMTIKFFPIFFMEIYLFTPIAVQLIMGSTALLTGITSIFAQRFSIKRGRAKVIFIVQGIATLCLFIITFYPPAVVLLPIFLARGSLMNASQPLSRSILMDVVPKYHRGKVNSLQALAWGLFWNVSAALGGFLIGDNNNFRLCFLITTIIYVLGTAPILILIPLVTKEKKSDDVQIFDEI